MLLNCALKKVWYDAIDKGRKTVEYRDMSDYWLNKLLKISKYGNKSLNEIRNGISKGELPLYLQDWTEIMFHHQQDAPLKFEITKIAVYDGHTTFAIHLGQRLK